MTRHAQRSLPELRIRPEPVDTSRALLLAAGGIVALVAGVLVYLTGRPAGSAYLLPGSFALHEDTAPVFGWLGGVLPGFIHVLAFSLLTVAALRPRTLHRVAAVPAAWFVADLLFEIGQHPAIAPHIAAAMPEYFRHLPLLENVGPYFLRGTFDVGDIVAYAAGALAAYALITCCEKQSGVP
jgi:hypothetical protein